MSWRLVDVERTTLMSRRIRETLSVGNVAHVYLEVDDASDDEPTRERIGVRITETRERPGVTRGRLVVEYLGTLIRPPTRAQLRALVRAGEIITFYPDHIADWEPS